MTDQSCATRGCQCSNAIALRERDAEYTGLLAKHHHLQETIKTHLETIASLRSQLAAATNESRCVCGHDPVVCADIGKWRDSFPPATDKAERQKFKCNGNNEAHFMDLCNCFHPTPAAPDGEAR